MPMILMSLKPRALQKTNMKVNLKNSYLSHNNLKKYNKKQHPKPYKLLINQRLRKNSQ